MRFGPVLLLVSLLLAMPAIASSVAPGAEIDFGPSVIVKDLTVISLNELVDFLSRYYVNLVDQGGTPSGANLAFQVILLGFGLVGVVKLLPKTSPYSDELVCSATSRTLWTIARKPFERWADKWSLRPRRPNSAPASTFNTSDTGKPL